MEKVYRCGWCGSLTNKDGTALSLEECKLITDEQLNSAELVPGDCCRHENEGPQPMRVTHEMAMDACMPEIEGDIVYW